MGGGELSKSNMIHPKYLQLSNSFFLLSISCGWDKKKHMTKAIWASEIKTIPSASKNNHSTTLSIWLVNTCVSMYENEWAHWFKVYFHLEKTTFFFYPSVCHFLANDTMWKCLEKKWRSVLWRSRSGWKLPFSEWLSFWMTRQLAFYTFFKAKTENSYI